MKREQSLKTKNLIGSIICGVFWFIAGLFELWHNLPCMLISLIGLIGAFVTSYMSLKMRDVGEDEMSELHYLKAKATVYDGMFFIFLILSITLSSYNSFSKEGFYVNWGGVIKMFIGAMQIATGIYFAKLERDGDIDED